VQTSNEELQASNEELLASNEELQSTNEELYKVNAEYQRKLGELTEPTNDMDNLLAATGVGTVFLDKDLKIRKFTCPIAKTVNLLPHDVGRSIDTFRNDIGHPGILDDLRHPRDRRADRARDPHRPGGTSFLQLLPCRAKGGIDGVVLTLLDVSGLEAAEDALFHERNLLDSVPDAINFRDARGKLIRANGAMGRRTPTRIACPCSKSSTGSRSRCHGRSTTCSRIAVIGYGQRADRQHAIAPASTCT
jgi:two-component system, chemotaxis family, CheB/CheR fusion protein